MKTNIFSRIHIICGFIVLFAVLLITRLFYVQIVHGEERAEQADRQYITPAGDIFDRGTIYFKKKNGELVGGATTISGFRIAISPKSIVDKESIFNKISKIINIDEKTFLEKANKENDPYEEIATHILKNDADKIVALNEKSVSTIRDKWRFYPGGNVASHTIGFVGFKGDEIAGRYGLESYYNSTLMRQKKDLYVNFFAEVFSNIKTSLFNKDEKEGNVVTSIEPVVQDFLTKKVSEISDKWNSDGTGAIIIDPKDGSIYAMSYVPDFDPNNLKNEDVKVFSNPLVESVREFGSVIKPLVMAAALDQNVLTKDTTYDDKGFVIVNDVKLNNFDKKGRGPNTSMQEVLNQSLNTGMVFVEKKLGKENFRNYMLGYELGVKTGIDLPNEATGLMSNLKSPRELEYATASFGQGIAMTPMEAVKAFSSLANGGHLIQPHLAEVIKYEEGGEKVLEYPKGKQVIKKETSDEITNMLVTIVDKALGEGKYKMEHYGVAAKTGTAQIALPDGKGYYEDRHMHSFFGYFPASNPQFLMLFFTLNPKGAQYASNTLPAPFMETAKFLLSYYEVPPDR
jgi:cell division protein FtsI/penicillin-binding protein 2